MRLTEQQADAFRRSGLRRELGAGDAVMRVGDAADEVLLIESGEVDVLVPADDADPIIVARLDPMSLLGEIAVVAGGTRTADAVCVTDAVISALPVRQFAEVLDADTELSALIFGEARRRMDASRVVGLLRSQVPEELADAAVALGDAATVSEVAPGEWIYRSGDTTRSAFIVLSGRVDEHRDDGTIRTLGRDQLFGADALVDDAPRGSSVRAVRESSVACIDRDDLDRVSREDPDAMLVAARLAVRAARTGSTYRQPLNVAVVVAADLDTDALVASMVAEASRHGATAAVSSSSLEASLGRSGIADADSNSPGVPRLTEHLHTLELDHAHVLHIADPAMTPWTRRAIERSDRMLLVVDEADAATNTALVDEALEVGRSSGLGVTAVAVMHRGNAKRPRNARTRRPLPGVTNSWNVRRDSTDDLARVARLITGNGVGLVLSGGGGKGFAHLGVARVLGEHGVPIDVVGGASIGGPVGASLAAYPYDLDTAIDLVAHHFQKLRDYTLPMTSMLRGKRITDSIRSYFDGIDLEDMWLPFYVVTTNLTRSRVDIHRSGSAVKALRATVSIPGVLPPVPHDGDLLVDGGVLDNLPIGPMRSDPTVGTVICVDVASSDGPRAEADFGMDVSGVRSVFDRLRRRVTPPSMTSLLVRTMLVAAARDRDANIEAGLADLYIDLELGGVGLLDFGDVPGVAAMGAEQSREQIQAWLASDDAPTAFRDVRA